MSAREFRQSQFHESEKMAALGTLALGMANSLNNALAGITTTLETVRALHLPAGAEDAHQQLAQAQRAARGAARLVRRLAQASAPAPSRLRPVDPATAVAEAVAVLERELDRRVAILTRWGHGTARILADPEQIADVLVNMGHNAGEAMPDGGVLTFSTALEPHGPAWSPEEGFVRIEVQDTGRGIAPAVLPRVFEPFFTTKRGAGSGLGLAPVYGILQQHGGGVSVESVQGEGTVFHLYLRRTSAPIPAPDEVDLSSTGTGTILVIDDDPLIREPMRRALAHCGYEVCEAPDGPQGLTLLDREAGRIDLVVLDLWMPGPSGLEVLAEIKRRAAWLPVILMSGHGSELGLAAGPERPDAYLGKPFPLPELVRTVRRLIADAALLAAESPEQGWEVA